MITISHLGCGYWGPNLIRALGSLPDCRVKWIVDTAPDRKDYAQKHFPKSRTTMDVQEPLNDPEVDAITVATPPATHFPLAKAAILSGKHVFVEKPLTLSWAEADELAWMAKERQRILMAGHIFLFHPALRYLNEQVQTNQLGQIHYIHSQRTNLGRIRSDVNAWWNLAPHDVSIVLHLMNDCLPATVYVRGNRYLKSAFEDVAFATLAWDSGVLAHIHVGWLEPEKRRKVTVVGNRQMAVYDDMSGEKLRFFQQVAGTVTKPPPERYSAPVLDTSEPLRLEAQHFLECIRTGAQPLTGPDHSLKVMQVLEAGQKSLRDKVEIVIAAAREGLEAA